MTKSEFVLDRTERDLNASFLTLLRFRRLFLAASKTDRKDLASVGNDLFESLKVRLRDSLKTLRNTKKTAARKPRQTK